MEKVIIFSGAGISAESGISTFRDAGGLWDEYKIEEISVLLAVYRGTEIKPSNFTIKDVHNLQK